MCNDKECDLLSYMKQYQNIYRKQNKEKINALRRQKYFNNPDAILVKNKEYKLKHKKEIQKKKF